MKRFFGAAAVALTVATAALPASASAQARAATAANGPQAVLDELLAADRAFARAAADVDGPSGWAAAFADDIMMPTPTGFAKGKAAAVDALRAAPGAAATKVTWAPVRGGISADGQHGFTYGYMTTTEAGKPDRLGKYLAYWVRKPEGWRMATLRRAGQEPGDVTTAMMPPALPARLVPVNAAAVPAHAKSLEAAETAFATEAGKIGLGPAFAKHGRPDSMLMGRGAAFRTGSTVIGADMGTDPAEAPNWGAQAGVLAASSGDLGVTFGYIYPKKPPEGAPPSFPFFTVWKRDAANEPWRWIAE